MGCLLIILTHLAALKYISKSSSDNLGFHTWIITILDNGLIS